jgi:hypothetical protein
MADTTRESEAILREAGRSLAVQREGGYHRRAGSKSIGEGSAALKRRHLARKLRNIVLAVAAIVVGAMVVGLVIDGLGFIGLFVTFLAIMCAIIAVASQKVKVPRRADLNRGDVKQLVARTELWLEHQRPALPAPAARIVEDIGVQLDALGLQLEHVDPAHPAAAETRKLVGEYLPEMIDSYRRIPENLRREERAGATPDKQLEESLRKISGEIDHVTRQLADGALDDLAIRSRYLDYKFGNQLEAPSAAPSLASPPPLSALEPPPRAAAPSATEKH